MDLNFVRTLLPALLPLLIFAISSVWAIAEKDFTYAIFSLCGLVLFFGERKKEKVAISIAGFVCLMSMDFMTLESMNKRSAICLLVFGLSSIFYFSASLNKKISWAHISTQFLNFSLLECVALWATIQNSSSRGNHSWFVAFHPIHTQHAILFSILGLACLAMLRDHLKGRTLSAHERYSALSLLVLVVCTMTLSQAVTHREVNEIFSDTEAKTNFAEAQIKKNISEQALSLSRMARRLDHPDAPTARAWREDAHHYVDQLPVIQSLAVLNGKNQIRWAFPDVGNEIKNNRALYQSFVRGRDNYFMSPVVHSGEDALSFTFIPIFPHRKFGGFLVAALKPLLLVRALPQMEGYGISLIQNDEVLYNTILPGDEQQWRIEKSIVAGSLPWKLVITPTAETIAAGQTHLPRLIFCLGLLVAFLFSQMIHLVFMTRSQSKIIENQKQFLDTIIRHLPMAVSCKNIQDEMRYTLWNQRSEQLYGLTGTQVVGSTDFDLRNNEDAQTRYDQDFRTLQNKDVESIEEKIKSETGSQIFLHTYRIPIQDTDGKPLYLLEISEDITEQKFAEAALRNAEKRFSAFMENSPAMAWIKDAQGNFLYVNAHFEKTLRTTRDAVIGRDNKNLSSEKYINRAKLEDQFVMDHNQSHQFVQEILMPDQSITHWLTMKFPIVALDGVKSLGAIAFDISERIALEKGISETQEALKTLIEFSPLPILTLNLEGKVQIWNAACERVFGWSSEEVVGSPLPFVPSELKSESTDAIQQIIAERHPVVWETRRVKKDGSPIEVRIAATYLSDGTENAPYGLMAILDDISQRKAVERSMHEAKLIAEKAADAKSAFLANVSHEIRTPLNGIIGMTDLLLDSTLLPEQKRYAEIVHQSGFTLLNLINDILDLSKIDAGKLSLETNDFALISTVENQVELLAAQARQKKLSLMTFIDPKIPNQLIGDPGRLSQVLSNLLGNAIKFTATGGILVRVLLDEAVSPKDGKVTIRFEVMDSGIGISDEVAKQLFQPFTQAEASTSRRFGGTGLGLSICKRLVEMMEGEIGIVSEGHDGSTFWFKIRFLAKETQPLRSVSLPGKKLRDTRVLVIDADANAAGILGEYCQSWGMRNRSTLVFENGLAAIEEAILEKDPYNVVILSENIPDEMNDCASTLKNRLGAFAPKMILAHHFENSAKDRVSTGLFASSFSKPVKQSHLFDAIAQAVFPDRVLKNLFPVEAKTSPMNLPMNSNARILVVDDVLVNQMLTLKLLEKLGYQGTAVANGFEALEALRLHPYQLILMDCQMPEMDGFEATKRIREMKDARLNSVPIVALTANAMNQDELKCLSAGMNDYLSKPIKREKLAEKLKRWLKEAA